MQWREQEEVECGHRSDWWASGHLPGWAFDRDGPGGQEAAVGRCYTHTGVWKGHNHHFSQVSVVAFIEFQQGYIYSATGSVFWGSSPSSPFTWLFSFFFYFILLLCYISEGNNHCVMKQSDPLLKLKYKFFKIVLKGSAYSDNLIFCFIQNSIRDEITLLQYVKYM